jgi:hypothetical protein
MPNGGPQSLSWSRNLRWLRPPQKHRHQNNSIRPAPSRLTTCGCRGASGMRKARGEHWSPRRHRGLYLVFPILSEGIESRVWEEERRCLARGGSKAAARIASRVRFGCKKVLGCCPAGRPPVAEARCRYRGNESLSGRSAPRPLLPGRGESQAFRACICKLDRRRWYRVGEPDEQPNSRRWS